MSLPKVKHPGLCRLLIYQFTLCVPLAAFAAVLVVWSLVDADIVLLFGVLLVTFFTVFWLIGNVPFLLMVDVTLASLAAEKTARERFVLTDRFSVAKAEKRLSRFGKACSPPSCVIPPDTLRFRSTASLSVYSYAIEKTVAVYHVDHLDRDLCTLIFSSAKTCSKALSGKKKYVVIDRNRKKAPLNRTTVVVIFAKNTDVGLYYELPKTVCRYSGDGENVSFLPCVVDLCGRYCVFDSTREIYEGMGAFPAKNRGIGLIRRLVFGGRLPLSESPKKDSDRTVTETAPGLLRWMIEMRRNMRKSLHENSKMFKSMSDRDAVLKDGYLHLKWGDRAIMTAVVLDNNSMTAVIDEIETWDWPTGGPIAKKTVGEMKFHIDEYFDRMGYRTEYGSEAGED
jgi:hypothetical protein